MTQRTTVRLAWTIWALTVVCGVAFVVLEITRGRSSFSETFFGNGQEAFGAVAFATVGALVASRQKGNAIGWLFLAIGASYALSGMGSALGDISLSQSALWQWGIWINTWSWVPGWFLMVTLLLLLFPDGHLPSPRWRWAGQVAVGGIVLALVGGELQRTAGDTTGYHSPLPPTLPDAATNWLLLPAIACLAVAMVASLVALVVRYRRSRDDERLQMKWFVYAAVVTVLLTPARTVLFHQPAVQLLGLLSTLILPVAVGIAVFKYRLYDIDVVISKTIVYALLALFIGAVYAAIVIGVRLLLNIDAGNPALSIVATGIVAVTFQPVRDRVQRFANRLVYGHRADPYEVLTRFSERVGSTYATEDVLPRTVRVIAEGVNAERAAIWLRLADELRPASTWPDEGATDLAGVPLTGDALPHLDADHVAPIRYRNELLGAISVDKPRGEPMTPEETNLVDDLAAQAGLVVSNVRLTADLEARLELIARQAAELRASRQRIVAAQDEERRRLERNIHDGAQQHLVALAVKLRLARGMLGRDPERARTMLSEIGEQVDDAIDTLRALALGIYPPLLEEHGVAAALAAQYQRAQLPVTMRTDGTARYPIEIEATVYFCVLEALQNAAKYADARAIEVRLAEVGGALQFVVTDDGVGFDPMANGDGTGIAGMRDRLSVFGGDVTLSSTPGRGTVVQGRVPLASTVPA